MSTIFQFSMYSAKNIHLSHSIVWENNLKKICYFSLSKKCCGIPSFLKSGRKALFPCRQLVTTSQDISASEGNVNQSLKMSLDLVSSLELMAFTPPKTYMQPDGVTVAE